MAAAEWSALFPEEKLLARSLAATRLVPERSWVLSHTSAAALWGLPMFGLRQSRVHVTSAPGRPGKSSRATVYSRVHLDQSETVTLGGIRFTGLERTLNDLAHDAPAELAMSAVDAGARRLLNASRTLDFRTVAAWRTSHTEPLNQSHRAGIRNARMVFSIADPRADSPAESVSRLQLHRLGVAHEAQVSVRCTDGRTVWMDFELLGQGAFGEVDGVAKYTSERLRGARSAAEVVLDEKLREDEVRGVTGKRVVRWTPRDIAQARTLGLRLQRFGIRVPGLAPGG